MLMRSRTFFALALLLLSTLVVASTTTTTCKAVSIPAEKLPVELQSREPAEVMTACDVADEERVHVVALAFDGPSAGVLFPIDARGTPLQGIAIGRPRSVEVTRLQSGGWLFIVKATAGTGTGVRQDDFLLFRADGEQTRLIWQGMAYYRDLEPTGRGSIKRGAISVVEDTVSKSVRIDHVVIERRVTASSRGQQAEGKPRITHQEKRLLIDQ